MPPQLTTSSVPRTQKASIQHLLEVTKHTTVKNTKSYLLMSAVGDEPELPGERSRAHVLDVVRRLGVFRAG